MLGVSLAKTDQMEVGEAVEDNVGAERSDNADSGEKEAVGEDLRKSQDFMRNENANQFEHKEQTGDTQNEPEVKVDLLNNVALEVGVVVQNEHHLSENYAPAEPCEKEASDDHQCGGHTEPCEKEAFHILKCAPVSNNSLKEDAPDKGTESLDEEKRTSIEGEVQEEAKDASVISAESCEDGLSGVKDSVAVEIDATAKLAENTLFDDH